MNIFISDDSETLRERLQIALSENRGLFVVGQADTARSTIEGLKTLKPDVLIQDISMREENGLKMVEEVKRHFPEIMVIVFTNHPEPQYRTMSLRAGADHYFVKSTGWNGLLNLLKEIEIKGLKSS